MSNAILVRGHMRFCENDNNDLLNRYANKIYSQNTFNGYTPLELSKNALEMYNNIVALFENLKPCQYNAPAIYKNISLRNKIKEYMLCIKRTGYSWSNLWNKFKRNYGGKYSSIK